MITLLGFAVISIWFYQAAADSGKSTFLWVLISWCLYFGVGIILLFITEEYILNIDTLADAFSLNLQKIAFQLIGMVIVFICAYIISEKFLKKKRD